MGCIEYLLRPVIVFTAILIGSQSTVAKSCFFSPLKVQKSLCIVNASSNLLTVSSAVQCVFDCKNASFLNVIGDEGTNIKCQIYTGSGSPLFVLKEGCRIYQVCSYLFSDHTLQLNLNKYSLLIDQNFTADIVQRQNKQTRIDSFSVRIIEQLAQESTEVTSSCNNNRILPRVLIQC